MTSMGDVVVAQALIAPPMIGHRLDRAGLKTRTRSRVPIIAAALLDR